MAETQLMYHARVRCICGHHVVCRNADVTACTCGRELHVEGKNRYGKEQVYPVVVGNIGPLKFARPKIVDQWWGEVEVVQ